MLECPSGDVSFSTLSFVSDWEAGAMNVSRGFFMGSEKAGLPARTYPKAPRPRSKANSVIFVLRGKIVSYNFASLYKEDVQVLAP
jgi:hypothetical protein